MVYVTRRVDRLLLVLVPNPCGILAYDIVLPWISAPGAPPDAIIYSYASQMLAVAAGKSYEVHSTSI